MSQQPQRSRLAKFSISARRSKNLNPLAQTKAHLISKKPNIVFKQPDKPASQPLTPVHNPIYKPKPLFLFLLYSLSYLIFFFPLAMATTLPSTLSFVATPSFSASVSSSRSPPSISFPLQHRRRRVSILATATVSPKVEEVGTAISNLTLEEARHLVDYLSEKLGVSAAALAAPVAVAAAPGAAGGDAAAAAPVEQTEFAVIIEDVPSSSRINTIKVIHLYICSIILRLVLSRCCISNVQDCCFIKLNCELLVNLINRD